jgi:hypothetical protein
VLLTAREADAAARPRIVLPRDPDAVYVLPRTVSPRSGWYHHLTVEVVAHNVDALTGVDGHEVRSYLAAFFEAPELHRIEDVDLARRDL